MLSRAATRTTTSLVTKRGFHATRARLSSPYHYPEGPYSNIPFNPRSKWFGVGYWGFMATGFFAPFGIAELQDSVKELFQKDGWGFKKMVVAPTLLRMGHAVYKTA